jgi:hypothetical protein
VVGLGWPAVSHRQGRDTMWQPAIDVKLEDIRWLTISDAADWEVQPVSWASPLHASLLLGPGRKQGSFKPGIMARSMGPPVKLTLHAARNGFWRLPVALLARMCRHYGVHYSDTKLFTVLVALIRHFLPKIQDEEVANICAMRIPFKFAELMHEASLGEGVDQEVQQAWGNLHAAEEEGAAEVEDFKAAVHKLRRPAKPAPGSKRDRAGAAMPGAVSRMRWPMHFPSGVITQETGAALVAPGARIYRDSFNARWQCFHPGWGSFSRSFALYGESLALLMVARWSWECYTAVTGEKCPMQWLWDDKAAVHVGPSGGSASSSA